MSGRNTSPSPKIGVKRVTSEITADPVVDSTAVQERQIVATTFANVELANTKRALEKYVELYNVAIKENEKLKKELKERDLDSLQVLEYLRMELAQKTSKLDDLERQLKSVTDTHEAQLAETSSRLLSQLKSKDDLISSSQATINNLQKELEQLSLFSRERQEILIEMDRAKEAHQMMINKYERELTKLRFQTIEEKVKLKAAETEMVKKFNTEVDARATILVDVKAKSIHENNKNLVHDKALLEKEVSDLVTLATEVQAELKEAQRNAGLDSRIQQEAMRHTAKLNKVARESDAKAQTLEIRCQNMTAEFDAVLQQEREMRRDEVSKLQRTIEQLQKSLELHRAQLVRTRQLAGAVVSQRSDLEHFFYEVLDDIRRMQRTSNGATSGGMLHHVTQEELPRIASSQQENWYTLTRRSGGKCFSTTSLAHNTIEEAKMRPCEGQSVVPSSAGGRGIRAIPSPRDLHLRKQFPVSGSRSHPTSNEQRQFFTSASATGDPEETTSIPALKEEGALDAFPMECSGASFSGLSWTEKELIVRSLLYYVNQSFYTATHSPRLTEGTVSSSVPPFLLPSQHASRMSSGDPGNRPVQGTNAVQDSSQTSHSGVPPLAPRAPISSGKARTSRRSSGNNMCSV